MHTLGRLSSKDVRQEPVVPTKTQGNSRCDIKNSLAMIVRWERNVIVHNQPDVIDSPEAGCPTHPRVGDVTVSQRAFHVVKAMNEGQLPVGRDVQVAYLIDDGAFMC